MTFETSEGKNINYVCVKRGYEINSDHYLVEAKIKPTDTDEQKEKRTPRKELTNIKSYKLRDCETAAIFEVKTTKEIVEASLEEIWD